jgi:predicted patatin/cPLA2 family phospholipase
VCEGGGQRGIFTAGVLDELCARSSTPLTFFGTSAGAQNLSAYCVTSPVMRVRSSCVTPRPEFFDPVRFVRGGNLIDLDWLMDSTSSQMPLAMDYAARV